MFEVLAAVGALALFGLLLFQGQIMYALTDGVAIKRLAALRCPDCDKTVGSINATEAAEAVGRENDEIATIHGGYVPSTNYPVWLVRCDCGRALSYQVAGNTLRAMRKARER